MLSRMLVACLAASRMTSWDLAGGPVSTLLRSSPAEAGSRQSAALAFEETRALVGNTSNRGTRLRGPRCSVTRPPLPDLFDAGSPQAGPERFQLALNPCLFRHVSSLRHDVGLCLDPSCPQTSLPVPSGLSFYPSFVIFPGLPLTGPHVLVRPLSGADPCKGGSFLIF